MLYFLTEHTLIIYVQYIRASKRKTSSLLEKLFEKDLVHFVSDIIFKRLKFDYSSSETVSNQKIKIKNHFSDDYAKCSKIANTLKLRTPKIIAENNFQNILKNRTLAFFWKSEFLKLRTQVIFGGKSMSAYVWFTYTVQGHLEGSILLK